MKRLIWLVAFSIGAAGCGDGMMRGMGDADRMTAMVDDLRVENDAHHSALRASPATEVNAEMNRHEETTANLMDDMGTMMGGMSQCSGDGMQDLRGMHDAMMGEMAGHMAAMSQPDGLVDVTVEADRHAGAVHRMLAVMDTAVAHMDCGM